jgi:uncharacterized protein YecE (DUF72 family)
MANIYIGTSGFSYKGWGPKFYEGVPQRLWLEHYAKHYNSVEINNSFYRLPATTTYSSWRKCTPAGFRFAIKGSRYITSTLQLKDAQQAITNFFDRAQALEEKLSVVLWQLPPFLHFDPDTLVTFLQLLQSNPIGANVRHSLEPRHHSWFNPEYYQVLRSHNVGHCIAHSQRWPSAEEVTTDFMYLRFHGAPQLYATSYTNQQLQDWADKAQNWLLEGKDIYAYFNNEGHAITNSQSLGQLLTKY